MIKKPTLTDSIVYAEELQRYRFAHIFSGVGNGKNHFFERFIEGNEEHNIPKKTVLIATSRRAKVDEVLTEDDIEIKEKVVQNWNQFHHVFEDVEEKFNKVDVRTLEDEWGEHYIYQESAVCTNVFIEAYSKYIYRSDDITTHLWELSDIIIIDEVHSVILDATYQSAPFYVHDLVNEYI